MDESVHTTRTAYQQMAQKVEHYIIASGLLGVAGGFAAGFSPILYDTNHPDWAPIAAVLGLEAVIGAAICAGRACRTIQQFYRSNLPPTDKEERFLLTSGEEGKLLKFPPR